MNPGMDIFRRYQRLQGGTGDVRYTPVTPTKEYPYSTDYEFIHRKVPDVDPKYGDLAHLTPEEQDQEQRDWDENIKELLTITPNLTSEERQQVLTLNPKDWDDSTSEKVHAATEQAGTDTQLQQGDDDVGAPRRPLTEKELLQYEPWIRDMIRSIPLREPRKGPQFRPKPEPFGPDEMLPAQQGTSNVNNVGLRLFMAGQGQRRKKQKL